MDISSAKTYVARIIGGANTPGVIDMANEAILRAYSDWQAARFWTFLLKDTSVDLALSCTVDRNSKVITPINLGELDFINYNQSIIINNVNYLINNIDKNINGSVTGFDVTPTLAGSGSAVEAITFKMDIPITAGVEEYGLPTDMNATYTARLIGAGDPKTWLKYIEQRQWDKISFDQTTRGVPEAYTIYNPVSQASQNFGQKRLRLFRVPNADGLLRLRYFRNFYTNTGYIDVPDDYLYKFLDYARSLLLEAKRAQDDPHGYRSSVLGAYAEAQQNDEAPNDDDDNDSRLKSPYEGGTYRGPIVNNGQFDPFPF